MVNIIKSLFKEAKEEIVYQSNHDHPLIINHKIDNEEIFIEKIFEDFLALNEK